MDEDLTRLTGEEPKENLLAEGQAFGHYKVIRLLGRGGMGEVYEVEHTVLHRKYALKVIRRELFRQTSASERFRREAQVMNHLEHPHIVPVDDYGETGGHTWLRMPLLGGYKSDDGERLLHSLGDRMREREPIPEKEVRTYLEAILSGLSYAHGKGAIHRDIKPSNILFEGEGGLKIADFGLVSVAGEDWLQSRVQLSVARSQMDTDKTRLVGEGSGNEGSSTQALLGTFEYMSPEQKRGEMADARSDLYAVGLIAFRMLTGQEMPGFEMPSDLVPGLNRAWDSWFKNALSQSVDRRFQTAREMLEALPEVVGSGGKGKTVPVRGGKRRIETEGKPEGTETKVESGSSVKSGRKGVWMILLLLAGALGYYLGVVAPEQARQAELARIELEKRQAERLRQAIPAEYTGPEEGEGLILPSQSANNENSGEVKRPDNFRSNKGLSDGLDSYFAFDGDIENKLGTNRGNALRISKRMTGGLFGGALLFDGDDYVRIERSRSMKVGSNDSFSLNLWFKSSSLPKDNMRIISQSRTGVSNRQFGFTIRSMGNSGDLRAQIDQIGLKSSVIVSRGRNYFNGRWHMTTLVYDKGAVEFYIDAQLIGRARFSPSRYSRLISANADLDLGANTANAINGHFTGLIDEFAWWKRGLRAHEIRKLYNGGQGLPFE